MADTQDCSTCYHIDAPEDGDTCKTCIHSDSYPSWVGVDQYGNPKDGSAFDHCSFPDCGCDGARLCQAKNGPSLSSVTINIERGSLK